MLANKKVHLKVSIHNTQKKNGVVNESQTSFFVYKIQSVQNENRTRLETNKHPQQGLNLHILLHLQKTNYSMREPNSRLIDRLKKVTPTAFWTRSLKIVEINELSEVRTELAIIRSIKTSHTWRDLNPPFKNRRDRRAAQGEVRTRGYCIVKKTTLAEVWTRSL